MLKVDCSMLADADLTHDLVQDALITFTFLGLAYREVVNDQIE